jgi:hypothetical protein
LPNGALPTEQASYQKGHEDYVSIHPTCSPQNNVTRRRLPEAAGIAIMEGIFKPFKKAHVTGNGYQLADILLPLPTASSPNRLNAFYQSSNFQSVRGDIEYQVIYGKSAGFKLSNSEGKAWVEVFVAYWKAIGELLKAEEATQMNAAVRIITFVIFESHFLSPLE